MLARLFSRAYEPTGVGANQTTGLSIYDWQKMFAPGAVVNYGGNSYRAFKVGGPSADSGSYQSNAPVFALEALRVSLFSEARFQWQQLRNGKPGDLFGSPELQILEEPWPGATTGDLLAQAELDVATAGGNSYWVRQTDGLLRLNPAEVKILTLGSRDLIQTGATVGERLAAYVVMKDNKPVATYEPSEVCHFKPYPSPVNRFIGQSWLSACLPDIQTDETITAHKQSTITNGAMLKAVVVFPEGMNLSRETFDGFIDRFHREHENPENAGKTLFLSDGVDVKTVGQSFENLQLQATQGASEVRIAACAGIPPAMVGFSEGLKGSTLNAGNYGEARRRLADGTMRPLWRMFATAMQSIVPPPGGARLWYDDRDVAFLREDLADQSNILATNSQAIMHLIQAGYEPDAAVEAVTTGDLTRLATRHTGLFSVQLQPPMSGTMPNPDLAGQALPAPSANGNKPIPVNA